MHRHTLLVILLSIILGGVWYFHAEKIRAADRTVLCLDPGHGDEDAGTVSGKFEEKTVNLDTALALQKLLLKDGNYVVYLTRTKDVYLNNRQRADFCNSKNAALLISIHQNDFVEDPSIDFSEGLYVKSNDKELAGIIAGGTSKTLGLPLRGIEYFDGGVMLHFNGPATISEALLLTSAKEQRFLTQNYKSRIGAEAQGIKAGIDNYRALLKAREKAAEQHSSK